MVNICKGYMVGEENVQVLKNINFNVDEGEFVAILGPSGSGKTTLMNIIGCMDVADTGEYYLDGQAIHTMEETDLGDIRNQEIGFIFQNYQLIPTYNIMQNIIMPLLVRGMTTAEAEDKCMDTIKLLGIDHRLRHKPSELSGGEKQRVAVARALINNPSVLLADEPSGSLDSKNRDELHKLLFDVREKFGLTLVIVTHDKELAALSDRVIEMKDGKQVYKATVKP